MRKYIGIDPGADGAVAIIDGYGVGLIPVGKAEPSVDLCGATLAMVEKGHAMPKQGGTSMFTFGKNCGRVIGWLEAANVPFQEVTARAWQKIMLAGMPTNDRNSRKASSILVAQRLFPGVDLTLGRGTKPKDGASDALLIAEFARRTHLGQTKGSL